MSNTQRIYPTFSALLALSACLVVVWCRKSPDSAGNVGEKNGIATVTANEKPTSNLQAEFTSAVNKIVSRSRQTNRASESIQPVVQSSPLSVESSIAEFTERQTSSAADAAQYASDMNDVMDEMLNRSEIPADYAETMVALFSDKSRGDVIRDFAVQHIGLYAETLNMRGKYNADSSESATLRAALWDAAEDLPTWRSSTRTSTPAASTRALPPASPMPPPLLPPALWLRSSAVSAASLPRSRCLPPSPPTAASPSPCALPPQIPQGCLRSDASPP